MAGGSLEIFLKLDGIDGESTVIGHEKAIVVLSYEQAIDHAAAVPAAGGSGSGRASFSGIRFRKYVDSASVPILLGCSAGTHIKEAVFTFRKAGSGFQFYKVTLESVVIVKTAQRAGVGAQYPLAFDTLNQGDDSAGFLDEVTLACGKIHWEYVPQRPDGSPGTPLKGGWDIQSAKKI